MASDLDSEGSTCPGCLSYMLKFENPLFFTCGCMICQECYDDLKQCPQHYTEVCATEDHNVIALLMQLRQQFEEYERTWTDDRSAIDTQLTQVRQYVMEACRQQGYTSPQVYQPQAYQQVYQPQPASTCPTCYRMTELPRQCSLDSNVLRPRIPLR